METAGAPIVLGVFKGKEAVGSIALPVVRWTVLSHNRWFVTFTADQIVSA